MYLKEKRDYLFCFIILISLLPILIFRDFTPDNELRYLSIAKEAVENGNVFAFYNHGNIYADKPPLYLWLIMSFRHLSLGTNMFILSLFSVIPAFIIIIIMNKWIRSEVDNKYVSMGEYLLITTAFFLGSALVLRMDMLMSMFIVLSLYTFYKMYKGDLSIKNRFLFPIYLFLALFTKGPFGILIPILSIIVFLFVSRKRKTMSKYLGWYTWVPLLLLFFVWISLAYNEGGKEYVNNLLFHQTVNRAVDAFHHKKPIYFYFIALLYTMSPWVIFYILVIVVAIKKRLINTDLKRFFISIIAVTFIMLSLISSKVAIYLLPILPFIVYLVVLLYPELKNVRYLKFGLIIPNVILLLPFPFIIIMGDKLPSYCNFIIYIAAGVLFFSSVIALCLIYKNRIITSIRIGSLGIMFTIFIAAFILPSANSYFGYELLSQKVNNILAIDKNDSEILTYKLKNARDMDIYIDKTITPISQDELKTIKLNEKNIILLTTMKEYKRDNLLRTKLTNMKSEIVGNYIISIN